MSWHRVVIERTNADAGNGWAKSFFDEIHEKYLTALAVGAGVVGCEIEIFRRASADQTKHEFWCSQAVADIAPEILKKFGSDNFEHKPDLFGFNRLTL